MLKFMKSCGEEQRFGPQEDIKLHGIQLKNREIDLILSAIKFGDLQAFVFALERLFKGEWQHSKGVVLSGITMPGGGTVLHQAALMKGGALEIVKFICETAPFLMSQPNCNGDTVWHLAVRDHSCAVFDVLYSKREDIVNGLIRCGDSSNGKVTINGVDGGWNELSLGGANHTMGNTALHEAFLSGNRMAAGKLFVAEMDLCYRLNKENKSPLYMAAELGDVVMFNNMLRYAVTSPDGLEKIARGKSIVRVAISKKLKGFLTLMWDIDPRLFELTDADDSTLQTDIQTLGYLPGAPKQEYLQTARSIGPFIVNYDGLLKLKNSDMPAPVDHVNQMRGAAKFKKQTLVAVSRGKSIIQNVKLWPQRGSHDEDMIDLLLILSILVILFSFILIHIPSLHIQPLYGLNIILLYMTCVGTLVLCLARVSGNGIGLTSGNLTCYLTIVTSMSGLVLTILINLLIKTLLYVVAVTVVALILPIFLLKPFIRALIIMKSKEQ